MANTNGGRTLAGAWGRRIALCCLSAISTTLLAVVIVAALLIMSGVLEW